MPNTKKTAISWPELIKKKITDGGPGTSFKDVIGAAKTQWKNIKAGNDSDYVQGKPPKYTRKSKKKISEKGCGASNGTRKCSCYVGPHQKLELEIKDLKKRVAALEAAS